MDTTTATTVRCGGATPRVPKHLSPRRSEERQRLLMENLSEVRHIARRIYARLPPHVLFDDLVHSGVLGLIDAVEKFDPAKNSSFRAYSQFRIRGAILDSLRELDWSPRSLRRQARRIEQADIELTSKLGRIPSQPEVAAHLGFPLIELQHILTELHGLTVGTRQAEQEFTSPEELHAVRSNRTSEDPFELCVRTETTRMLMEAIDTLDERERRALALYYFEERTMKEVGRVLHIHESRVSQIISGSLDRLRERL